MPRVKLDKTSSFRKASEPLIIPGHENASFPLYHAGLGDLLKRKTDPGREIKLWPGPNV